MNVDKQATTTEEIVRRRLSGEPVAEISNAVGVSRQYIYMVISKFPKNPDPSLVRKGCSSLQEEFDIVIEYLNKLPPASSINKFGLDNCAKEAVSLVSKERGISQEIILATLYKMTDRHSTVECSPHYKAVDMWRKRNAISLRRLSEITNIPTQRMREILKGWQHLPLDAAQKIAKVSGLSIEDIYADIIEQNEEGSL